MTNRRLPGLALALAGASLLAATACERRGPSPAPPYRADSRIDTPTTGRHGTTGEVGGGIDAQSGPEPAGALDRRQAEAEVE